MSDEDGDGAGYDIASFAPNGQPRLIEVKTTNGWERTPFHISRNGLAVADDRHADWRLFRLWNFSREPKAFELQPPLDAHVLLTPTSFQASFRWGVSSAQDSVAAAGYRGTGCPQEPQPRSCFRNIIASKAASFAASWLVYRPFDVTDRPVSRSSIRAPHRIRVFRKTVMFSPPVFRKELPFADIFHLRLSQRRRRCAALRRVRSLRRGAS